jgi:hypothetical protein
MTQLRRAAKALPYAFALTVLVASLRGVAQTGIPTLWLSSPTGQEQIDVTAFNPGAQKVEAAAAALRDASGYQKLVPLTGFSITVGGAIGCNPQAATAGNCVSVLQLTPAGTLSTGTIKTPLYPVDGQRLQIFSTQAVSTLTMTASQNQTLNGGLTSLSANTGASWLYSAGSTGSNGTWDRIQ